MVIPRSLRATQLACQKRVRGNDHDAKLTVPVSLTSLWLRGAILKGCGECRKVQAWWMQNSGELSDAAIAFLVERWCPRPDTLSAFSIDMYGRFKDDIIIVARNRALTKHVVWSTKRRSKYYKIKVEEVSNVSVKRFVTSPEFQANKLVATIGSRQCSRCSLPRLVARCTPHQVPCFVEGPNGFPESQTRDDQQVHLAHCA